MNLGRKQDLSVIYWLKDMYEDDGITIVDGYPDSGLIVPSISVTWDRIDTYEYEMGNKRRAWDRSFYLDIYAKNKTQKDEIVFRLLDDLVEEIDVNDYDEGFPPLVTPTKIGILKVVSLRAKNIQVYPEITEKMHYRALISLVTLCEMIGGI